VKDVKIKGLDLKIWICDLLFKVEFFGHRTAGVGKKYIFYSFRQLFFIRCVNLAAQIHQPVGVVNNFKI